MNITINSTLGLKKTSSEIYCAASTAELLQRIPGLLQKYTKIGVYSRGRNWGYGCRAPASEFDMLIDLSLCDQIKNFEAEHGIVTLEPGVTYQQLADFLKYNGDQWIAPVHGGGPDCSVLGNALERGYGITPISDHFSSLMSLKAILPNGKIYEGALKKIGQERLDRLFRYGIGPYYDGLFTQSGLGIVTEITIKLARKPEFAEMFYFNIFNESDLEAAVLAIKKSKQELGSVVGGLNLMNRERLLSMFVEYPEEKIVNRQPLSEEEMAEFSKQFRVTPWLVVGMLYGPKDLVNVARKRVLSNFRNIRCRKLFYNTDNRRKFLLIQKIAKLLHLSSISNAIEKVELGFQVLNGRPNRVALNLAYWKNLDRSMKNQDRLNPTLDNCGLIWYAPLVEMTQQNVRSYVEFIKESSEKFNFNSLITLTTVDDVCFDSTVPILFNKDDDQDKQRAWDYYNYLLQEGAKRGFFPYRLNIETQKLFDFQSELFGLKFINPGRYS